MFKIELRGLKELQAKLRKVSEGIRRETAELNQTRFVMPIEPDERGLIDRECPECTTAFKVDAERWDRHVGDVRCPYHGHIAARDQWYATEHVEAARAIALRWVGARFENVIRGHPTGNATTLPSIDRIVLEDGGGWRAVAVPAGALALLKHERSCTACGCRFAFIGAAFFCPLCGCASGESTFDQTLANIRRSVEALPEICRALDRDLSAELSRTVLEKHIQDIVTSFQRVGEALYLRTTGEAAPQNAFQRLDGGQDGSTLWSKATGQTYQGYLGGAQFATLVRYFQRRHLLAHCEGIVDAKYLAKTCDSNYTVGQRIRVVADDVIAFVAVVERLVAQMRADAPSV